MTRIFISYSRKDKAFAGQLTECLEKSQLETWIDWEDIPPTADWLDQIHKGIQEADGFLFLLSPDSVASKVCRQETDHAAQNGKRLIPIVVRDVNADDVHPALAKVNWIYARESDDFDGAVDKILLAIRTDLAWVESQRRLQVRALEWEKRKDRSLLLRGKDLREAEEQLARAGQKDPQPTDLQRRYVLESRRGESRTRNLLLVISAVIMVVLALLSVFAINQRNTARDNALTAVANQHAAQTAEANAESERRIALSNGLSSNALLLQEKNEIGLALLLSVQANQFAETARSRNALYTLLKQNEYMLASLPVPPMVDETFPSFRANATSDLLLAKIYDPGKYWVTDAQYIVWDLHSHQMLDNALFPIDSPISVDQNTHRLEPNDNGRPLDGMLTGGYMDEYYLGSFSGKVEDALVLQDSKTAIASYCKFAKSMASRCVQLGVYVFGIDAPFFAPRSIPTPTSAISFLEIAYDRNNQLFALADADSGVMQLWQEQNGNLTLINTFKVPGFISLQESKGIEFKPDLQLVAWGTGDNKIILWDLSKGIAAGEYQFDFPFNDFVLSPDGTMLALQSESGTKVFVRDQTGLKPVETNLDPKISGAMSFDGDGRIFAVGAGTQIWVFDTSTWKQLTNMKITSTGTSEIDSIFVSADGKTVAVGMNPVQAGPVETSYLIDIQTSVETGPFDEIMTPILSPNNYRLASMGPYTNEGISLWNLDIGSWEERACQIANRNLTHAEWGQYMGNEPYQLTCPNFPDPALNPVPTPLITPTIALPEETPTAGAIQMPNQFIQGLDILSQAEAAKRTEVKGLDRLATELYADIQLSSFGDNIPINLVDPQPLSFSVGWCAATQQILDENLQSLQMTLEINNQEIPDAYIATLDFVQNDWPCRSKYIVITRWEPGEYRLTYTGYTPILINDGKDNFGPGQIFTMQYTVTVP